MRRWGLIAAAVALLSATAVVATPPNVIIKAEYTDPTDRYDHGILGDAIEWGTLVLTVDQCFGCEAKMIRKFSLNLSENRVFEDIAPRLADVDGDELPEVIVIETDVNLGARLAIYTEAGLLAATPFIGRTHRWLAPIGAADLDGDGYIELAYVDRPHLAKTIRVWRFKDGKLKLADELPGFTNHRIGEDNIAGGVRDCGNGPEMIVADARWNDVYAVKMNTGGFAAQKLAPHKGRSTFAAALACKF